MTEISTTQVASYPHDAGCGATIDAVVPEDWGDVLTYPLTIEAGGKKQVSDSPFYPMAARFTKAAPELTELVLWNESEVDVRVGGIELDCQVPHSGFPLIAGNVTPQCYRFNPVVDPGNVYVCNPGTGAVTITVVLIGKVRE